MKTIQKDKTVRSPRSNRAEGGTRTRGMFNKQSAPGKPLVTVITVVRNGKEHIELAIQSVLRQTYDNIEYIIVDGASTDGTVDFVKRYDDRIAYWISEPDRGISDAFNKGINMSQGEIIGILNADDWYSPDQVGKGVRALYNSSVDFVFGDLLFHDTAGRMTHRIKGDAHYEYVIHSRMPELSHPTVLVKRTTYERIGLFGLDYRYAMDYEWFLRLHTRGGKGIYVQDMVGHMRLGGISDSSHIKALREVRNIAMMYGQPSWKAHYLYIYRVVKGLARRKLEQWAPKALYELLRSMINRRYSAPRA
jgi:glycosyltransferase involved in cell wall biosynthesis